MNLKMKIDEAIYKKYVFPNGTVKHIKVKPQNKSSKIDFYKSFRF
jgi:hypothetical protein